jgi:hypothetical protein
LIEIGLPEQQRVTVGVRLDDHLRADDRAGAAAVLDHDRLTDGVADALRDDPCHRVGAAAGRIGDDETDGPRGIVVGKRGLSDTGGRKG